MKTPSEEIYSKFASDG